MNQLLLFLFTISCIHSTIALPAIVDQYTYMLARNAIKQSDSSSQNIDSLNDKELVVDVYLEFLKSKEFNETSKQFYSAKPIEKVLKNITSRELYRELRLLPKGGNLHMHEFQMLDRREFLRIVMDSDEYEYLYICDQDSCGSSKHFLKYYKANPDKGWTKVKGSSWTLEEIAKKTNLIDIINAQSEPVQATDSVLRWKLANDYGVFSFYSDLTKNNNTRFKYMEAILNSSISENVQILDLRKSFFRDLYYFSENGTKVPISAEQEVEQLIELKKRFIQANPSFIDFTFLIYSTRLSATSAIRNDIVNSINLQKKYPDIIRGYDMVGEEDQGHTILFHADSLRTALNYSKLTNGTFNLFFHNAETNWPEDQLPANYGDAVSTLDNIYDAIILNTQRIGHGLGFIKHPNLYPYLKEREIVIEVCPASNQLLGYIADLRNHPAINYHRNGIPIVLAGDDPGSFGYNELTVEYYLAFMSWGLNLADLKQIAQNSVKYSSSPSKIKQEGLVKFQKAWDKYIDETYTKVCRNTFTSKVNVSNILPAYGPAEFPTNVTIYGYGFESLLCKNINCVFGTYKTRGKLVHVNEIVCPTPIVTSSNLNVQVQIEADSVMMPTYLSYTFLNITIPDNDTNSANAITKLNFSLMLLLTILTIIGQF